MPFNLDKKNILSRDDKSVIKQIDTSIKPLVTLINDHPDFYTTSSCSGRIQLIVQRKRKCDAEWLFKTHKKAFFTEVKKAVAGFKEGELWFRQEAMILHVCCRTMEAAKSILNVFRPLGFKRSGIITMNRRIIVEMTSTEKLDTIIGMDGKLVVDDAYLRILVEIANRKLESNIKKIKTLEKFTEFLRTPEK